MEKKELKGYIAVLPHEKNKKGINLNGLDPTKHSKLLKEAFKGEVLDEPVKFPKELGVAHPFDFAKVDKIEQNVGIVHSSVGKITDSILGDFSLKAEDEKIQVLLDNFVEETDLLSALRPWIKEAVSKGNGYLDLTDIANNKVQVLNAKDMWVKRNKKAKVLKYNQFLGRQKGKITLTKQNVNEFEPNEIAHLQINTTAGEAYGRGFVWPNKKTINNYASSELSRVQLLERKAGAPIIVTIGQPGESVQNADIDAFRELLQYMTNKTEWVVDGNTKVETLQFGDIAKSSTDGANHDLEQLAIGMRIPMVMMGVANVPEGLAKEQDKDFLRFINSIRVLIEDNIETKILKPFLETQKVPNPAPGAQGTSSKITFIWELPGDEVKDKRLASISSVMSGAALSPEARAILEKEYLAVLGLEEEADILEEPEEARKRQDDERKEMMVSKEQAITKKSESKGVKDRKKEESIKQPEVPGEKPTAKESKKVDLTEDRATIMTDSQLCELPLSEYVNITEIPGFNFSDYLVKILQALRVEEFNDLRAITERDIDIGLLPKHDIEKLRLILKDGFQKNKSIKQIEKNINQSINLKDRKKETDGKVKITQKAENRPNMIARTETIRMANQGLKRLYLENDIEKYRYLAALDDRTSEICQSLNGQVFLTKDGIPGTNMPPMHANCRSTIVGLIE